MIALSNPRSSLAINQYNFGVEAIRELIGALEDVRRFDACLIVEKSEVDARLINELQVRRTEHSHVYTAELCRDLILWAWTLDNVHFEPEAKQLILDQAVAFTDKFSEAIPIVDRGSMRYKLARLSAALAARTFSVHKDTELLVRECHVEYICRLLNETYTKSSFGYDDFTAAQKLSSELLDVQLIEKHINDTPFPTDVVKQLLFTDRIELQDIQDWCAWDRTSAQNLLSLLVRKHALVREKRHYRKTSPFIALLKRFEPIDRPAFITEEEF